MSETNITPVKTWRVGFCRGNGPRELADIEATTSQEVLARFKSENPDAQRVFCWDPNSKLTPAK